jgi:N-acetylglucosamine-6-sulfatase
MSRLAGTGGTASSSGSQDIGDYFGYKLNENGRVVAYGKDPSDYLTDVLAEKAVTFIQSASRDRTQPMFLYFAPYAPHAEGAPDGPPTPAPRHKGTLAHMTAPRPPSFNEADVSNKPSHIQKRPLLNAEQIGELDHEYRTRVESLLAVDEAVERIIKALADRVNWQIVTFSLCPTMATSLANTAGHAEKG